VISESTGVGMWQTVAVRVVNEEEERRAAMEAVRAQSTQTHIHLPTASVVRVACGLILR
jgi:Na+-transporting methylmalonyl-CoA/oxaloacetate decarboxylase beta subunit